MGNVGGRKLLARIKGRSNVEKVEAACELLKVSVDQFITGIAVESARIILENGGIPESTPSELREHLDADGEV